MEEIYKYTEDGRKVYVHEEIKENVTRVSFVFTDEDDEEEFLSDKPVIHDGRLYDDPPAPVLHAKVKAIEALIQSKKSEFGSLCHEIETSRKTRDALLNAGKSFRGLETLSDILENPITHLVLLQGEPRIMPVDGNDVIVKEARVAAIGIKPYSSIHDLSFNWFVKGNDGYFDCRVIPCTSEEKANEILKREYATWVKDCYVSNAIAAKCVELGIPIPLEGITKKLQSMKGESRRYKQQAEDNLKSMKSYDDEIAELEKYKATLEVKPIAG